MERHCAGCSAAPLAGTSCPNISVRTMTRRTDSISGMPTLRVLEVKEIKTVPYVPLSHPFVERLIGAIRREYLDRVLFWTTADLEQKLLDFQHYYNRYRVHAALAGSVPEPLAGRIWIPVKPRLVPVANALSRVVPNTGRCVSL